MKLRIKIDLIDTEIEATGTPISLNGEPNVFLSFSPPIRGVGEISPNDANALAALLLTAVNQANGTVPGADSEDGPKAA